MVSNGLYTEKGWRPNGGDIQMALLVAGGNLFLAQMHVSGGMASKAIREMRR